MSVEDGIPEEGQATTSEPTHDWEKDYKELQATYTQSQQRLKELEAYESDRDAYFRLGQKHGVEFEIDDPNAGQDIDPHVAELRQQNQELMAWKEQVDAQMQAERNAAGMELFHEDLDKWAAEEDVKLSKADHNAIYGVLMQSNDPTQEHYAKAAFEAHVAHLKSQREQWQQEYEEQRKRPRVPHTPGSGGTANTAVPDFSQMSRADIDKYMAERVMSQQ